MQRTCEQEPSMGAVVTCCLLGGGGCHAAPHQCQGEKVNPPESHQKDFKCSGQQVCSVGKAVLRRTDRKAGKMKQS